MKKIVIAAIATLAFTANANALTLKKGEVITSSGEVVHASESENTRRAVENNGYHVVAGQVVIDADGTLVAIDIDDLRGKRGDELTEVITGAIVEELTGVEVDVNNLDVDTIAQDLVDSGLSVEEVQSIVDDIQIEQIRETAGSVVADAIEEGGEARAFWGEDGAIHAVNCQGAACDAAVDALLDNS